MRFKDLPFHARHTYRYDIRSAALAGVFGGLLLPFVSVVGRKIGATHLQIALLAAAPYLANAFTLLWTEDLFGRGRVWYVVWPGVIGRGLLAVMFWVYTPAWYTAVIFFYMFITAVPYPSYAFIMKSNYPEELRGALMSRVRVMTALFWIVSSTLAGYALQGSTGNYRYLFPAAAVFGVLAALELRKIRLRSEDKKRASLRGIANLMVPFRDPVFLRFIAAYTVFETGMLLALPVFPLVLVDESHISNFATGIYGSVFSGMWLAGFFFWGRLMDSFTMRKTLMLIFAGASVIPLLYLLSRDITVLGVAQGAAGFVFAAIELANYILVIRMAGPKEVTHYMAASIALGGIRGALAPFIGTALYASYGAAATFSLSLFMVLFSILLAFVLFSVRFKPKMAA